MDPKHRDRIAFVRVCSGKFERDMTVHHSRSEKKVRLSSSHKLFGNERETVDEAYPGDVIGLVGHDSFGIGDTLTTDPKIYTRKSRGSRRKPSATCTIRTRPSSSNSARAWTS
jgi:peptide chain release factor 3